MARLTASKRQTTGPALGQATQAQIPEMPIGLVPDQCVKEAAPDPVWEEGRKLRNEAERALKRFLLHSAKNDRISEMTAAAKAIEQLRGW